MSFAANTAANFNAGNYIESNVTIENSANNTVDASQKISKTNQLQNVPPTISGLAITSISDSRVVFEYNFDDGESSSTMNVFLSTDGGLNFPLLGSIPDLTSGDRIINLDYGVNEAGIGGIFALQAENAFGITPPEFLEFYFVPDPAPTSKPFMEVTMLESRMAEIEFNSPASIGVDGYLIAATADEMSGGADGYQFGENPEDFVNYNEFEGLGDGTFFTEVKAVITDPNQIEAEIDFYTDETDHVITLIPFNWNGTNADSKNYDDGSNVINADVTTPNDINIFRQPRDMIGCAGEEERIISLISGDSQGGDLNYQWMRDGRDLVEGVDLPLPTTQAGLIFSELSHTMSGVYTCDVWKTNETREEGLTSEEVVVFVVQQPEITKQPQAVYASLGETAQYAQSIPRRWHDSDDTSPPLAASAIAPPPA